MSDQEIARAVDGAGSTVARAIDENTKVLKELLAFLTHGPEYKEQEFQSAEEDKIDDSVGVYDRDGQAKSSLKDTWRSLGYPEDVLKHLR